MDKRFVKNEGIASELEEKLVDHDKTLSAMQTNLEMTSMNLQMAQR